MIRGVVTKGNGIACVCNYGALALLIFRHLGHHFLKPGDFADIALSSLLHFVQSMRLLNAKDCTKQWKRPGTWVASLSTLMYSTLH